jgi:putative zinc finger protein
MTADTCREWRELLGSYALGGLDDDERTAVAAHLEGCAECRAELAELAPMGELLMRADPDALDVVASPSSSLGRRISRRVKSERRAERRRRLRFGLAGAGAVAALAATLLVLLLPGGSSSPVPIGKEVRFAHLPSGVRIAAHLEPQPYGSEIDVYVRGMRRDTRCVVFLRGANGRRVAAGSFFYSYHGDAGSGLSAAIPLRDVRAIGIHAGKRTFVAPLDATT